MKKIEFMLCIILLSFTSCFMVDNIEEDMNKAVRGNLIVGIPNIVSNSGPYENGEQNTQERAITDLYVYLFDKNNGNKFLYTVKATLVETLDNGVHSMFPLFTENNPEQRGKVSPQDSVIAVFIANYSVPATDVVLGETTLKEFRSLVLPNIKNNLQFPFVMYGERDKIKILDSELPTKAGTHLIRLAARIDITNEMEEKFTIRSARVLNGSLSSFLSPHGTGKNIMQADQQPVENTGYNVTTGLRGTTSSRENTNYMWSHLYTYANTNKPDTATEIELKYTFMNENKTTNIKFLTTDNGDGKPVGKVIPITRNKRYVIKIVENPDTKLPEFRIFITYWEKKK